MTTLSFTDALHAEVTALVAQFPDLAVGLAKAQTLVASGAVFPEDDGRSAMVRSQSDPTLHHAVNGTCDCKASQYHTGQPCAHRLAWRLYQRVCDRLAHEEERWTVDLDTDVAPADGASALPTIRPEWLVQVQGRPFIRFEGLLELAHTRGLQSLETVIVQVSEGIAVCQATAVFADGRRFTDVGDATEKNVARHLAPHYIRMAGTRASARVLRRALNVSACAVEELGDEAGS